MDSPRVQEFKIQDALEHQLFMEPLVSGVNVQLCQSSDLSRGSPSSVWGGKDSCELSHAEPRPAFNRDSCHSVWRDWAYRVTARQ